MNSRCLNSRKKDVISNLGQYSFSIIETVNRIAKIFNKKVKIKIHNQDKKQKYVYFEEQNDFNEIFNHRYKYTFEEGIKEFSNYLKSGKQFF